MINKTLAHLMGRKRPTRQFWPPVHSHRWPIPEVQTDPLRAGRRRFEQRRDVAEGVLARAIVGCLGQRLVELRHQRHGAVEVGVAARKERNVMPLPKKAAMRKLVSHVRNQLAMKSYTIEEAKDRLSHLVDAALAGEAITITRRGKPVATLRPVVSAAPAMTPKDVVRMRRKRLGRPRLARDSVSLVRKLRDEKP
jgi:prevent-host-death family protein